MHLKTIDNVSFLFSIGEEWYQKFLYVHMWLLARSKCLRSYDLMALYKYAYYYYYIIIVSSFS